MGQLGCYIDNFKVIPHGIYDASEKLDAKSRIKARDELGLPSNVHVFIFVSANVDNQDKGFDIFLRALERLPSPHKWVAIVAGDHYFKSLSMMKEARLSNIYFIGRKSNKEIRNYFRGCDTYVTPTLSESYGLTVVEALAEGAKVVCTDLPVLREITVGKALFFEKRNINVLRDILAARIESTVDPENIQNSNEIRARYSMENMGKAYLNLYNEVISRKT